MASPYDMTLRDAEQHLLDGGSFTMPGRNMEVMALPGRGRFIFINDSGNGGDHVVGRVSTLMDLMEQYAGGSLEAWQSVGPAAAAASSEGGEDEAKGGS